MRYFLKLGSSGFGGPIALIVRGPAGAPGAAPAGAVGAVASIGGKYCRATGPTAGRARCQHVRVPSLRWSNRLLTDVYAGTATATDRSSTRMPTQGLTPMRATRSANIESRMVTLMV